MSFDLGRLRSILQQRPQPRTAKPGAAVAAILRSSTVGTETLLIQRTSHVGDPWSGQMALPGGRQDPSDTDLLHTAIRETFEEIGLDLLHDAELLGPLSTLDAVARGQRVGFTITPFVFSLKRTVELQLDAREVETTLWAPLDAFALGKHDTTMSYEHAGARYELPGFDLEGRTVWGLTYRILQELIRTASEPHSGDTEAPFIE